MSYYFGINTNDNEVAALEKDVKYYPLTHPQKGIWYTEKLYPGTSIGIVAGTLKIRNNINFNMLESAIREYIIRNDTLRLHFVEIDGEPKQYYSEYIPSKIETYEFSPDNINSLYEWDIQRTQTPFSLFDNNLYEIAILKIGHNEAGIYIKLHHLICDGWSIVNCGNDIFSIYQDLISGAYIQAISPPSYKEFINSENTYKLSTKFIIDREFWDSKFKNYPQLTTLNLCISNNRSSKAKRKSFVLPLRLNQKILEYCHRNKNSIFSLYYSALSIYLNRVKEISDITIGVPILNRSNVREKNTLGMFINTVPLRIILNSNISFFELSELVTKEWLLVLKHHKYPYDLILKDVRDKFKGIDDLYDITLSYQNAKITKDGNINHEGRWHFCGHQKQSLNIHINDRENDGTIIIDYDYLVDVFNAKEIEFLHDHIIRILWHAIDNPLKNISNLEMISEREKKKVLFDFNNTELYYDKSKTIIQLFEEQVSKTPDNVAVISNSNILSYKEFNQKVNDLAWIMINSDVKPNDVVAILMERSVEILISIFAILKCGATFLCIDPTYPKERIQYILNDSLPKLVLYKTKEEYKIQLYKCSWLNVSSINTHTLKMYNNPNIYVNSQSLAYIIYTSGSTGKPKGAMITHKGLLNYIIWAAKVYIKGEKITFPLYSSLSFDLTLTSIFTPLITGNSLIVYEENVGFMTIFKVFEENNVNIIKLTPAHLNLIKDLDNSRSRIKRLIVGGEEFKTELARQVYKSFNCNVEIFNEYGPTETVVGCMIYKYDFLKDNRTSVPIGTPADNVKIYILDKYLNPVPIGVPGELCIGGDGVCAGYLNKSELTHEKFIKNPFIKSERIYKSGDLARWFPKGDIEYLGRIDYQIKIKGYRVELGEIENQLISHECINEAVVIDRDDSTGKKYLCAYIVADKFIDSSDLRLFLLKKLPNYMIPTFFVFLEQIPLTHNGKVDRNSLPIPDLSEKQSEVIAPSNDYEIALANSWIEVLKIRNISIDDNIFELGADSLSIIQVQAKLLKYNWGINTQDFYKYQTIRLLADNIKFNYSNYSNSSNSISKEDMGKIGTDNITYDCLKDFGNVLITGVTGFLGMHLMNEILNTTDVKIYCIIREDSEIKALNKFMNSINYYFGNKFNKLINKRIFIIRGDITFKYLGLSIDEYNDLGNKVTNIIHSGALVKHYGDSNLFRMTNIEGTREVINFAMKFNIPLNHISTTSISGRNLNKDKPYIFTENDLYIGQIFDDNIYIQTKYEAEKIIIDNINNGLKANIFRIGNLSGRYSDGCFQINKFDNAFNNRIYSIINLGKVPDNILDFNIDLTPVDLCSTAIISLIKNYSYKYNIYHIYSKNKISIKKLIYYLNQLDKSISIVNIEEFKKIINEIYESNLKVKFLYSFINDFSRNSLVYKNNVIINNDKTIKLLKDIDFDWPICDLEYITKLYGNIEKIDLSNIKEVI